MSSPAVQLRERAPRTDPSSVRARARARLTVVPRRRVRAARMPFVTLVSLVLLGGIVGLLCFNTQMQQASFATTSLEDQAATLSAREQTLHDELQELRSPQHLATRAQAAGMVVPQDACTLRLAQGTADQACTPATRDTTPTLLPKAPPKPAVLAPAPHVVVVPAPEPVHPGHHNEGRRHTRAR